MQDYDQNVWFSPHYVIRYYWKIFRTNNKALVSREYQKEREAWIAAVCLLAISKMTKALWWIQIPTTDPPDVSCMTLTIEKNLPLLNQQDVEIMQITKYQTGKIEEEIHNKMHDKSYPKEYVLVVYLQRDEEIEDICNLSTKIIIEHSMVSSIWIIGSSSLTTSEFVIFSVFPSVQRFDVLIDEELKNVHQSDFLTMSRSKEVKFQSIRVSEPWHIKPDKIL